MRIVIGEGEALLREGLTLVLTQHGMRIGDTAADADGLVDLARAQEPAVVLTDNRMPPTRTDDGLRAALRIRAQPPRTPVMTLSQYVQRRYAMELMADHAGGLGYLLNSASSTSPRSAATCAASPRAAPSSTPRSVS